jgi:cystathionine gamma-lyase
MICVADLYGGSRRYLTNIASKTGIEIDYEMGCMLSVEYGEYEMVLLETPTNPTLRVYPIEDIVRKAKYDNPNIIVVVDNTFMSPMNQNPLLLGVDMVMHSLTKYINGHSDVVGGAVMCNDDDIEKQLRYHQYSLGAVPSPFDCYLIQRGIKTLPLRMEKHNTNALMIAEELSKIEQFTQVIYPGLPTHPDHLIAKNQCRGFGGIITVEYSGCVDTFVSKLQLFSLAESLGAVESLVNVPSKMTHASVPEEVRKELGISNQMIRLSIGCENADDLLKDILYVIDE